MKRWKYFLKPELLKDDEEKFLEWVELVEGWRKEEKKKALTIDNYMGVTHEDVYHEENIEKFNKWHEKLLQREKEKLGEE